jgi:hypothetical protein
MISHIVIPTLSRINNQITYNNLPQKYKDITTFVVQDHEYDQMSALYPRVLRLPPEITTIAPTREWIFNHFKDRRFVVFDDDLSFIIKEPHVGVPKWKSTRYTEDDFDTVFKMMDDWMNQGFAFGCLSPTWIIPTIGCWPHTDNARILTNVFYDGPKIPRDLEWNRVKFGEDFDVTLQLLTRGFQNRVSSKYMVGCSATNTAGGCSTHRTLEGHNESQRKLNELWPKYVRLVEKECKTGPWKGKQKLSVVIQFKRAYKSSQEIKCITII